MSATTAPSAPQAGVAEDKPCPQCGSTESWGAASWCPNCGYYPAFAKSVKSGSPTDAESEGKVAALESDDAEKPLWREIPLWVYLAVGGVLAIFAGSLAARFLLPMEGPVRKLWALSQFGLGVLVAMAAHTAAYFAALPKNDKLSPFDFFLKPFEVWRPTVVALPTASAKVCLFLWGNTAALCAVVLIGGLSIDGLFADWGVRESAKPNLVHAIVSQAKAEREGDGSLEDAMNDFVGDGEPGASKNLVETDCVVIGYIPDEDTGSLDTLILAAAPRGKLAYVGLLDVETLEPQWRTALVARLAETPHRLGPFVPMSPLGKTKVVRKWLEPRVLCRIAHEDWTSSFRLKRPEFRELLREAAIQ